MYHQTRLVSRTDYTHHSNIFPIPDNYIPVQSALRLTRDKGKHNPKTY